MVKLVSAKCPSCGASLKLSKDDEQTKCEYCHQTIIVDEAIACYKLKISGTVSIEGIETNSDLIDSANELLEMKEFLKAKRKFLMFSEKFPNNYQGWLGLLICRTRNFTIKDNNIMFENDVNKYYEHFLKVAPDDVKSDYVEVIENYLHPAADIKQVAKNIVGKSKKISFKIDPKYRPYIVPIIFFTCGLSLLTNSIFVGGLIWFIAGLILIPQIYEKCNLTKKKAIIISAILAIIGFIAFAIESPYGFVGQWNTADKNYTIKFRDDNSFVLKNNNEEISGTYSHEYKDDVYYITITSENEKYNNKIYKYDSNEISSKELCLFENNNCSIYFKKNIGK